MFVSKPGSVEPLGDFRLEGTAMRYSLFVPRLYNLCRELGMEKGKIMPSRAFCSDENQGYPVILIAKHFGTFPFNHGRVGGIVATDRHGPHAHHGKDMALIQASHVGYDPVTKEFGVYRRLQTEDNEVSSSCGKICGILDWYQEEYAFSRRHVLLHKEGNRHYITIDNQLLRKDRDQGLFLILERMVAQDGEGHPRFVLSHATSKVFHAADDLVTRLGPDAFPEGRPTSIGKALAPGLFYYRHKVPADVEGRDHLEMNLVQFAPQIVTSPSPPLTAAMVNSQLEFDRTYRTLVKAHAYQGKRLVFVAGLNIDVSPKIGRLFPLTKFVPWAAYVQEPDGSGYVLEQKEILNRLLSQSTKNRDQVDLESAIHEMESVEEIELAIPR